MAIISHAYCWPSSRSFAMSKVVVHALLDPKIHATQVKINKKHIVNVFDLPGSLIGNNRSLCGSPVTMVGESQCV